MKNHTSEIDKFLTIYSAIFNKFQSELYLMSNAVHQRASIVDIFVFFSRILYRTELTYEQTENNLLSTFVCTTAFLKDYWKLGVIYSWDPLASNRVQKEKIAQIIWKFSTTIMKPFSFE